ncbi:uncharacterized protein VTP21DRAFT_9019 [Calcarisporiella thermophila]|uniref:uncharacterized protein n=1 Tax=Calcarisporiella thermophila TaxID=911321 RepID=UPI003741FF8D
MSKQRVFGENLELINRLQEDNGRKGNEMNASVDIVKFGTKDLNSSCTNDSKITKLFGVDLNLSNENSGFQDDKKRLTNEHVMATLTHFDPTFRRFHQQELFGLNSSACRIASCPMPNANAGANGQKVTEPTAPPESMTQCRVEYVCDGRVTWAQYDVIGVSEELRLKHNLRGGDPMCVGCILSRRRCAGRQTTPKTLARIMYVQRLFGEPLARQCASTILEPCTTSATLYQVILSLLAVPVRSVYGPRARIDWGESLTADSWSMWCEMVVSPEQRHRVDAISCFTAGIGMLDKAFDADGDGNCDVELAHFLVNTGRENFSIEVVNELSCDNEVRRLVHEAEHLKCDGAVTTDFKVVDVGREPGLTEQLRLAEEDEAVWQGVSARVRMWCYLCTREAYMATCTAGFRQVNDHQEHTCLPRTAFTLAASLLHQWVDAIDDCITGSFNVFKYSTQDDVDGLQALTSKVIATATFPCKHCGTFWPNAWAATWLWLACSPRHCTRGFIWSAPTDYSGMEVIIDAIRSGAVTTWVELLGYWDQAWHDTEMWHDVLRVYDSKRVEADLKRLFAIVRNALNQQ